MVENVYHAHRIEGHSPHHPVLSARLQLVEMPVGEQEGPVPALAEAIHLQRSWLGPGWYCPFFSRPSNPNFLPLYVLSSLTDRG